MTTTTAGFVHAIGRICRVHGATHTGGIEPARALVGAGPASRH